MTEEQPVYEWDDAKSAETRRRRGFGFDIKRGFQWEFGLCIDIQYVEGEEREKWIGPIDERLYAVVTTLKGRTVRIISLRRAEQTEIALWRREVRP